MPGLKKRLFILILSGSARLYGQDTLSVYFQSGSSDIEDNQLNVLNSIPMRFDLSELDSVHYIGVADSIGDLKSNIRLSEKRAIKTSHYCKRLFPENYLYKTTAMGERAQNRENK